MTKGSAVKVDYPTKYEPVLNNSIQTGNYSAAVSLSFLGLDDLPIILTRGISCSGDMGDDPGNQRYTLLLVSNDVSTKSSFLFENIRTEKSYSLPFTKTGATEITVNFIAENRDSSQNLIVQDTLADLVTILGGRSPI